MRLPFLALTLLGGVTIGSASLISHHAFSAEFDADRPMELHGTVTKTEWINPHSWIHILGPAFLDPAFGPRFLGSQWFSDSSGKPLFKG